MASSNKRKTTAAKRDRERRRLEKRQQKQAKKLAKTQEEKQRVFEFERAANEAYAAQRQKENDDFKQALDKISARVDALESGFSDEAAYRAALKKALDDLDALGKQYPAVDTAVRQGLEPIREKIASLTVGIDDRNKQIASQNQLDRAIDTVVCLNVLEHLADDRAALKAIARLLPTGGHLVLQVPNYPMLFGSLDTAYGHFRRYSRHALAALCRSETICHD